MFSDLSGLRVQAVALANVDSLVSNSKVWVTMFISYVAARSNQGEEAGPAEGPEADIDDAETKTVARGGRGEGVSLVSAIGGR